MAILTVGTGQEYTNIAAAVAATQDGDTVLVQAGTYTNDFFDITHKITLQSVGGLAVINATEQPANGKGAIVVDNDVTIDGFGVTGVTVADGNGAGIRYDGGQMTVKNSVFWNNQNGILANADPNGNIVLDHSEFSANGVGASGFTHNIYINDVASLTVQNSYFHDVIAGHEIKSRAAITTIINNRIQDNVGGIGSYSIDLPDGGTALVQGNTIEKGPNSPNHFTIHYGGEGGPYPGSSLTVTGNTLISDNPNATLLLNQTTIPIALTNNQIYGFTPAQISQGGPVTASGNTTLTTEPTLDLTTLAPTVLPPPAYVAPPVIPVPDLSTGTVLTNFGPIGAVVASGHILTVGHSGAEFTSLQSAVAAAQDGDTIEVAAGTYVNDFADITHKIIIEGVGGIARFVQQNDQNQQTGILVINNDATIKNMEFTGTSSYNGHAAGIEINNGNVTIDNSLIDTNEVGLIAQDNPNTTLSIYNSEIGNNGNSARGTNNVQVGAIESLTMEGSYIHGATTGHEMFDDAFNTDIENTRIIDGTGVTASFLLDLAQGGNALLANDTLVKGNDSVNSILVHVGGEGTTYANSNVQINNDTLVTQLDDVNHPYTYFISSNADVTLPPVTANNDVFVGGVDGSRQLTNATGTGDITAATAVIDTSSPVDPAAAPALFPASSGPDAVTLVLSEARGDTDAQFLVAIDGQAIGGGVVTAAQTVTQTVNLFGSWSAGSHQVSVTFLNQQTSNGGGANNLYVQSMTLGSDRASNVAGLNGDDVFTAALISGPITTPTPPSSFTPVTIGSGTGSVVLSLAEDAWLGDALFTISVDGTQIGGTQTTTASHAAGQLQTFNVLGAFSSGTHTVSVDFLNDAWGGTATTDRNLYVASAETGGVAIANSTLALMSTGSQSFAFSGPTAAAADTLDLHVSEDAWQGDAQFTISIDGTTIGGVRSATASHSAGSTQDVSLTGAWGTAPHVIGISFINDAYGGTPATDRNLYVDGITYDGAALPGAPATLLSNGTAFFNSSGPATSTAITLLLAEDAWQGDALAAVQIDGTTVVSSQAIVASNASGQTQLIDLTAMLAPGTHDVAISFLNDAWGGSASTDRNLYVKGIEVNGTAVPGASAALMSAGTSHFQVVVHSP